MDQQLEREDQGAQQGRKRGADALQISPTSPVVDSSGSSAISPPIPDDPFGPPPVRFPRGRPLAPSPDGRVIPPSPDTRPVPPSPDARPIPPSPNPRPVPPSPDARPIPPPDTPSTSSPTGTTNIFMPPVQPFGPQKPMARPHRSNFFFPMPNRHFPPPPFPDRRPPQQRMMTGQQFHRQGPPPCNWRNPFYDPRREIVDLKAEIVERHKEKTALERKNKLMEEKISLLETTVVIMKGDWVAGMTKRSTTEGEECVAVYKQIKELEEKVKKDQDKIMELEQSANKAQENARDWESKCEGLEKHLIVAKDDKNWLEERIRRLNDDLKSLGAGFQQGPARERAQLLRITELERMLGDAGEKITRLENQIEERENEEVQIELDYKTSIRETSESHLSQRYKEEWKVKEPVEICLKDSRRLSEEREADLTGKIKILMKEIVGIQAQHKAEQSQFLADREQRETEMLEKLETVEKELAETIEWQKIASKVRDELRAELENKNRELGERVEELKKVEADFERVKKDSTAKEQEIEELKRGSQNWQTQLNQMEEQKKRMETELKKVTFVRKLATEELKATRDRIKELEREILDIEREKRMELEWKDSDLKKKDELLEKKARELERIQTNAVNLIEATRQEKEELVKRHQEEMAGMLAQQQAVAECQKNSEDVRKNMEELQRNLAKLIGANK